MSFFVAPVKRSHISCYTSEYKKASQTDYFKTGVSLLAHGQDKNTGNFIHFQSVQSSLTAVSYYIAGPYSFFTVSCYASWGMITNKAAERVAINQLFHLFRSHYFW
jgi:hypothetical protein